jgi:stress-induced morphogen
MKKEKLIEVTLQILHENHDIADLQELKTEIKKRVKIKLIDKTFEERLTEILYETAPPHYCLLNDNTFDTSKSLFANTKFKIRLTDDEFSAKELIIGHRMIPFGNPFIGINKIVLRDKAGNNIEMQNEIRHFQDIIVYISLYTEVLQGLDINTEDGTVNIPIYKLKAWMEREKFSKSDQILVSRIDYEKGIYQIEKISKQQLSRDAFIIKHRDKQLEEAILDTFDEFNIISAHACLLYAFAECDQELIDYPGTSIGTFLSNSEKIDLFNEGGFSALKPKDLDLFQDGTMFLRVIFLNRVSRRIYKGY